MSQSDPGFVQDIRISPRVVMVSLFLAGIGIFTLSFYQSDLSQKVGMAFYGLGVMALSSFTWYLERMKPLLGRWVTLVLLSLMLFFLTLWLNIPLALLLAFLPVGLAAALINLKAAAAWAVFQTGLTLLLTYTRVDITPVFLGFVLLAIWLTLGLMVSVYRPVLQVTRWTWDYYTTARTLLEEARNRKAVLEQAIQDLAEANQQLTRLNKLAQGLRLMAENSRTAKEKFVANVSHELRTPLNMIVGFTEMILQSPQTYGNRIPGALLADLNIIKNNAEHLGHLIDDVLDLSQIEADQMALTKELVHFPEMIEFALNAVQPLYKIRGLYLESEVPSDLPDVFCDLTRMREVLLNLLSNAGRFTDKGGVRVRAWREDNQILVSVSDTGPGIAEADIDRLFRPFEQLDGSIRRRFGGTGLGLAISKRFIELHDGRIWVDSQIGVGTTFTFRIPVVSSVLTGSDFNRWVNPLLPYEQRSHLPKLPEVEIRPRFVVLDSGDTLQKLLGRYLGNAEIIPAANLEEARALLLKSPAQALLVNQPSLSSAVGYLETPDSFPDSRAADSFFVEGTPVIICSVPGMDDAANTMNVSDILIKPISRSRLLGALENLNISQGTVLIVDDEPDALQLFGRMLASPAGKTGTTASKVDSQYKYRVRLARDGEEALAIIKESPPDVILLDLVMPNLNGYQFLEARQQVPGLIDIPVIVISARDPGGHPIASNGLVVAQPGGFSVRQLMVCIQVLSRVLSVSDPSGNPEPIINPPA